MVLLQPNEYKCDSVYIFDLSLAQHWLFINKRNLHAHLNFTGTEKMVPTLENLLFQTNNAVKWILVASGHLY